MARTTTGERYNARAVLIGVVRCEGEIVGCVRVLKPSGTITYGSAEVTRLSHLCEIVYGLHGHERWSNSASD